MTLLQPLPLDLDPAGAAAVLANLGFIASSDLPDRPGPATCSSPCAPSPPFATTTPSSSNTGSRSQVVARDTS